MPTPQKSAFFRLLRHLLAVLILLRLVIGGGSRNPFLYIFFRLTTAEIPRNTAKYHEIPKSERKRQSFGFAL